MHESTSVLIKEELKQLGQELEGAGVTKDHGQGNRVQTPKSIAEALSTSIKKELRQLGQELEGAGVTTSTFVTKDYGQGNRVQTPKSIAEALSTSIKKELRQLGQELRETGVTKKHQEARETGFQQLQTLSEELNEEGFILSSPPNTQKGKTTVLFTKVQDNKHNRYIAVIYDILNDRLYYRGTEYSNKLQL